METLEEKITDSLEKMEGDFKTDETFEKFIVSSEEFEKLIQLGLVKKRGNNLLSSSDAHIKSQVWFNVK